MPSQLQQLSLQQDQRPAAAAHHQRHHAQLHERRPTNRRENEFMQTGTNIVQLQFKAQLKREKKRLLKTGQRLTLDMHLNCCIPGTLQLYGGHCDDYTFDSGTLLRSGCRNYYDTLELQSKLFKQFARSSIHAGCVACGRDQAHAA